MPELVRIIKALCNEYGFYVILDALADIARLNAVDVKMDGKDRLAESWTSVVKALNTISIQHKGGL